MDQSLCKVLGSSTTAEGGVNIADLKWSVEQAGEDNKGRKH